MNKLIVGCIVLGRLETNCYFLHREGEYDAIVVDPAQNGDKVFLKLREKGLSVKAVLLTHGHFDHLLGVNEMKELSTVEFDGLTVYAGAAEAELLADPELNHSARIGKSYTVKPDVLVKDGDIIEVGSMKCKVIATPGHSIGSTCYYFEEDDVLISGDTLFFESVGRTDFPTGDAGALRMSVEEKLFALKDEVKVYPGHGDFTTIGHEKQYNPYFFSVK